MDGAIWGSKGQQIGYRRGLEAFNMQGIKNFDIDLAGNLINPITKAIEGRLQPLEESMPPNQSMDEKFCAQIA